MSLEQLRGVERASIHKADRRAASLTRDSQGVVFRYDDGYAGLPIATSLPLDADPIHHTGGALPPFFSGLLPEGRRLSAIRRAVKTSADDELTLLLAVGTDMVGDVRVLPEGEEAAAQPDSQHVAQRLAEVEFDELFARVLDTVPIDRVGLAGVQDKVSGAMISLPIEYAGASWIVKFDPPEFPHLVENEAFFIGAARQSGLDVVDAEVVRDRSGRPGLLVRRFDRVATDDGRTIARGQEDACQVLGRYPADKYRLTTEDVILGLAGVTGAPIVAARTLLKQFAFAFLTCNGDAHGKNFSIVQRDGEWHVSPAYDLPSSHPYGDVTMALPIGGKDREDLGRADFVGLGAQCGVPQKATERVLDDLVRAAPGWLEHLDELPFDGRRAHKLKRACEYRADRLRG